MFATTVGTLVTISETAQGSTKDATSVRDQITWKEGAACRRSRTTRDEPEQWWNGRRPDVHIETKFNSTKRDDFETLRQIGENIAKKRIDSRKHKRKGKPINTLERIWKSAKYEQKLPTGYGQNR